MPIGRLRVRLAAFGGDRLAAQLSRASAVSMAVRVAGLVLGFLSHLMLSRLLGTSQYGAYVIALGWAMVLVIPARLGLDGSVLRYATVYREQGRSGEFRGLVMFSLSVIAATSALIVLLLLWAKSAGIGPLRRIESSLVIGVALLIPVTALLGWFSALIRTANRIFASQFYEQVLRPSLLMIALAVILFGGMRLDAGRAMLATGLTVSLAMIAIAIHARASFRDMGAPHPSFEHRREWLSVSWVLFLTSTALETLNQIDVILLGLIGNASEAGRFAAAWRLASLVPFGLTAFSIVSGPLIASAYSRGDMGELARIARLTARISTGFAAAMAILLATFGKPLLSLFGPGFDDAYPALLILLSGGLANSFTGSIGYLTTMTGHQRAALASVVVALIVSVAVNLALIPALGALGSAIASALALALWNLLLAAYARRAIGIDSTAIGLPPRSV